MLWLSSSSKSITSPGNLRGPTILGRERPPPALSLESSTTWATIPSCASRASPGESGYPHCQSWLPSPAIVCWENESLQVAAWSEANTLPVVATYEPGGRVFLPNLYRTGWERLQ